MTCFNPFYVTPPGTARKLLVPCGKCLACRIKKSREWTLRLMHEFDSWENAVFITLTFDDEHLPKNKSIDKNDLQLYFKRLRKLLSYSKRKIKYYACGEYGETYGRPHYHAIIFGVSISEKDLLQSCWNYGFINVGTVTYDSCRYVSQYIDKKYSGQLADEVYTSHGLNVPFQLQSQRLGLDFLIKNKEDILNKLIVTVKGVPHSLPRYYVKYLKENEDLNSDDLKEHSIDEELKTTLYWLNKGATDLIDVKIKKRLSKEQNEVTLKTKTALFNKRHKNL